MNTVEIINKKRLGSSLSKEELEYFFMNYLNDKIPDYQMSALLMAICLRDMNEKEILDLTDIFIKSGDILDLSEISGNKVDKHSTGGVGDKTTLIIGPLVACCGVKVAKMSGRGLGHTGGTIDKLESIPCFKTNLSSSQFIKQVNEISFAITSQTANLVPLDKKIYALRDVTGTVESLPLIATSIMSKKIASGTEKILIDIKVGSGALIKTEADAQKISNIMKQIGDKYHVKVETIITDMNTPLGKCIGNSLEVMEAIQVLQNKGEEKLTNLCLMLATLMVKLGLDISYNEALKKVETVFYSGEAFKKFLEFVNSQEGDLKKLTVSPYKIVIKSSKVGIVKEINALYLGELAVNLGSGRKTKDDKIDYGVGVILEKLVGEYVNIGDNLCTLYIKEKELINQEMVANYFIIE